MKFVVLLLLCATSALADYQEIDWSNVVPVKELPEVLSDKPVSSDNERSRRIVNGHIAQPHQFPYQAALLAQFGSGPPGLCGGALIHVRNILTAAHCINLRVNAIQMVAQRATVILGAHFYQRNEPTQQRRVVERASFRVHPQWNMIGINNDIAILQLPTAVTLNRQVALIALPVNDQNHFVGALATVSGWGRYGDRSQATSEVLRFYRGPIISIAECQRQFPRLASPTNICLSGATTGGACHGDSGGPLSTSANGVHTHIGIVSFGNGTACENPNYASVFVRTSAYLVWIRQNMIQ